MCGSDLQLDKVLCHRTHPQAKIKQKVQKK